MEKLKSPLRIPFKSPFLHSKLQTLTQIQISQKSSQVRYLLIYMLINYREPQLFLTFTFHKIHLFCAYQFSKIKLKKSIWRTYNFVKMTMISETSNNFREMESNLSVSKFDQWLQENTRNSKTRTVLLRNKEMIVCLL